MNHDLLRNLPSVDTLLHLPEIEPLLVEHGHEMLVWRLRQCLEELRAAIRSGAEPEDVHHEIIARVRRKLTPSMRRAVNAAGVVLHTGLGRAMLAPKAVAAITDAADGYCTLATDPEQGKRMSRDVHLKELVCELTGAESATFANNNAAATMLILNTLAQGKEVIVSRGQLVEIGGAFRMPDVMEMSGAVLREVGTTNKTHLRDYAAAINENTGAILRVHQSNYRIVGFTAEPGIAELAELAHKHNLPVIDDLGSGALVDLRQYGLDYEPLISESLRDGADVACFSGDKLIGGPQSGVMVGRAEIIEKIKKNPLARALRIDKLTVAALEATLKLFLNREALERQHPTYRMFALTPESLRERAEALAERVRERQRRPTPSPSLKGGEPEVTVIAGETQVGSGSVPTQTLPTWLVSVRSETIAPEELARRLRYNDPPIYTRVHDEQVLFDLRTIQPEEEAWVVEGLTSTLDG
ncbi:MAG: L-seryl-tRNA(Sec) selenium transferase [Armatimonadota bacterium]